ncbi:MULTISPECIES: substrate-binding periplasmic protein [Shewanella]|uniref:Transporter substrate-binding domain-containing protein n=1 Tax=Shewanella metallivivens TaxID=2872342 RepID=A0ABT5TJX8_9GAMM|nr:transporter substrate-binding domain-containing protein [Shewanella metallivivens]MDD8058911.1 transporter substrate-binding domain-containing protein [Shewanella metallivivens]
MSRFVLAFIIVASVFIPQMVCARDKIVFYTESYPPFQSQNQQGEFVGFAIDILHAAQPYLDFDIDIQIMPWSRAYHNAQTQPNTFIFSIANTEKRLAHFKWIDGFYTVQDMIYRKSNRPDIVLDNIDDINRYTLALSRSDAALDRLKLDNKHPNVYLVRSQTAALKMLHFDRVDLIYNNEVGFAEDIKKMGYTLSEFTPVLPVVNMPIGISTHKDTDEKLADNMRQALHMLKQNGELAQITTRWFAPRVATALVTE